MDLSRRFLLCSARTIAVLWLGCEENPRLSRAAALISVLLLSLGLWAIAWTTLSLLALCWQPYIAVDPSCASYPQLDNDRRQSLGA